jgi:hypothetical protein
MGQGLALPYTLARTASRFTEITYTPGRKGAEQPSVGLEALVQLSDSFFRELVYDLSVYFGTAVLSEGTERFSVVNPNGTFEIALNITILKGGASCNNQQNDPDKNDPTSQQFALFW